MTPHEIFSQTLEPTFNTLKRAHVWGCTAYVLEPTIQDGQKLPKWSPRAKIGQFLGFSADHSTQIGLICNLRTNSINPQYHVVFDDLFTTVTNCNGSGITNEQQLKDWKEILCTATEQFYDPEDTDDNGRPIVPPPLALEWHKEKLLRNNPSHQQTKVSSPDGAEFP